MRKIFLYLLSCFILYFANTFSHEVFIKDYHIFTDFSTAGFELKKYLKKGGIDINVSPLPETDIQKGIYIVQCNGNCFGFSVDRLKKDGFILGIKNKNIYIVSKTKAGLMYGVYSFLEDNGYLFLTKDKEIIPDLKRKLKIFPRKENPAFMYREIFIKESDNPDFALKRRLNGRFGHRENKLLEVGSIVVLNVSLDDLVPYDRYKDTDPEYFCGEQLDFTNPEVKEIAKENLDRILSRHRDINNLHVLISTNDNNTYCENENSLERINQGGAPSTPYIDFVKFLASSLKDDYPDVKFLALAYLWSRKPPENYGKFPENMGVFYSLIEADFSIPLLVRNNTVFLDEIKRWGRLTDYIFVWHYITNFSNYLAPFPDIYQVSDDIRFLSRIPQVKGIFLQGAYNTNGSELADLRIYLFSKLLWNPNISVDKQIKKFFYYYGCNPDIMVSYVDKLYWYLKEKGFSLKVKTPVDYFNKGFLLDMYSLLSADKACYKDFRPSIDVAILLNKDFFSKDFLKRVKEELVEYVKRKNVEKYSENGNIKELISLSFEKANTPEEARGLIKGVDWLDFQDYSLKYCCSHIVKDRYASDRKAIAMSGNRTDWGIQLNLGNLKKGTWDIYIVARVQVKDGTQPEGKIAFRYGIYPSTSPVEVPLKDFIDGDYHTIYVGKFLKDEHLDLWIAPPGKDYIEYLLVDRVFAVKTK